MTRESLERSPIMQPYTGGDVGQRVVHCTATILHTRVIDSDSDDDAKRVAELVTGQLIQNAFRAVRFDGVVDDVTGTVEEPSKE